MIATDLAKYCSKLIVYKCEQNSMELLAII